MSYSSEMLLGEFNKLKSRLDELRVLLRKEIAADTLPDASFHVLVARTDRETVGVLVQSVEEVLPICRLTAVPDPAPWVAGLLNLGGEMVPVIDLSMKISGAGHQTALTDLIVICASDAGKVGLVVNEVAAIEQLTPEAVQAVPESLSAAPYLIGAAEVAERPVLLLNIAGIASGLGLAGAAAR